MVKYRAINMHCTNNTRNNESRFQLLAWVNSTLQSDFKRFEELSNGAAYCQLLEMLFPGTIALSTVYLYTNLEHESFENFKTVQRAFRKLYVMKDMPIDRLAKGRYHDNLEFLQWFKKFFDANYDGRPYDPVVGRGGRPIGYGPTLFRFNRSRSQGTKGCNRNISRDSSLSEPAAQTSSMNTRSGSSPMLQPADIQTAAIKPMLKSVSMQSASTKSMQQGVVMPSATTNTVRALPSRSLSPCVRLAILPANQLDDTIKPMRRCASTKSMQQGVVLPSATTKTVRALPSRSLSPCVRSAILPANQLDDTIEPMRRCASTKSMQQCALVPLARTKTVRALPSRSSSPRVRSAIQFNSILPPYQFTDTIEPMRRCASTKSMQQYAVVPFVSNKSVQQCAAMPSATTKTMRALRSRSSSPRVCSAILPANQLDDTIKPMRRSASSASTKTIRVLPSRSPSPRVRSAIRVPAYEFTDIIEPIDNMPDVDMPLKLEKFDTDFLESIGICTSPEMTNDELAKELEKILTKTEKERDVAFRKLVVAEKIAIKNAVGPHEKFAKQILSVIHETDNGFEAP